MASDYYNIIERFGLLNVAVIGEAMLDRYSRGHGKRLCAEAPVPIVDNCSTLNFAGAAANTAINLRALGSRVSLVSVVGNDAEARALGDILAQQGVGTDHIVTDATRSTLSKHRIFAGDQMLARFDHGTTASVDAGTERALLRCLDDLIGDVDLVVVSDYGYGIVTRRLSRYLARRLRHRSCCLSVDSRRLVELAHLAPTAVKPNYDEAIQLLGVTPTAGDRVDYILSHGEGILERTGAQIAAVTLDVDGAMVLDRNRAPHRTTTTPMPNSQAAGAGDTYLAAFSLALASRAPSDVAGEIAAAAAAVVVRKSHTATCSVEELKAAVGANQRASDLAGLSVQIERYRRDGRRIVLTCGCFDILHRGHVTYLGRARCLGDVLIVGVNSDFSIRQLKGPARPINCLEDRLGVLAGLSCVDHLVSFNETTPDRLIELIRPDIFVKGGDYSRETLPEASLVEALGGRVVILPYLGNHSTTGIVQRISAAALDRHTDQPIAGSPAGSALPRLTELNGSNGRHQHANSALG